MSIKYLVYSIFLGIALISCKGDSSSNATSEAEQVVLEETSTPTTEKKKIEDEQEVPPAIQPTEEGSEKSEVKNEAQQKPESVAPIKEKDLGEITFAKDEYDFGRLAIGKVVNQRYEFTNTGKGPLNIKSVGASCGCTVPSYPFTTIEPGKGGFIDVQFNSIGKMGLQRQIITVNTDGIPSRIQLILKGIVVPKSDAD